MVWWHSLYSVLHTPSSVLRSDSNPPIHGIEWQSIYRPARTPLQTFFNHGSHQGQDSIPLSRILTWSVSSEDNIPPPMNDLFLDRTSMRMVHQASFVGLFRNGSQGLSLRQSINRRIGYCLIWGGRIEDGGIDNTVRCLSSPETARPLQWLLLLLHPAQHLSGILFRLWRIGI